MGVICFIFGLLSIFTLAPLFVPLALVAALFGEGQGGWKVFGVILAIIGAVTSPTMWALLVTLGLVAAST